MYISIYMCALIYNVVAGQKGKTSWKAQAGSSNGAPRKRPSYATRPRWCASRQNAKNRPLSLVCTVAVHKKKERDWLGGEVCRYITGGVSHLLGILACVGWGGARVERGLQEFGVCVGRGGKRSVVWAHVGSSRHCFFLRSQYTTQSWITCDSHTTCTTLTTHTTKPERERIARI